MGDDDDDDDDDGNSLPLVSILSHIKPVHSPHSYFLEIRFINIIIIICQSTPESSKRSLSLRFPALSLYTLILSTVRATCPTNLNLLYLLIHSNILCSSVLAVYFSFLRHLFLIFESQFLSLTVLLLSLSLFLLLLLLLLLYHYYYHYYYCCCCCYCCSIVIIIIIIVVAAIVVVSLLLLSLLLLLLLLLLLFYHYYCCCCCYCCIIIIIIIIVVAAAAIVVVVVVKSVLINGAETWSLC